MLEDVFEDGFVSFNESGVGAAGEGEDAIVVPVPSGAKNSDVGS